jgi:ABC-type branched-subunit amino acid transport system substrate-binding protein
MAGMLRIWMLAVTLFGALSGNPALAQTPESIRIGGTLALTGRFSGDWGPKFNDFLNTWVKVVNEDGGVFVKQYNKKLPVTLIIYDDGSSPDKSVELYEKLAAVDKVDFFIGPATTAIMLRASTVSEKLQIPMVATAANDAAVFARNFQWSVGVLEPGYLLTHDYFRMIKAMNERGVTNYKTVAFVVSNTTHTKEVGEGGARFAKEAGLKVVAEELVPFGTVDYTAIITKLKALNPDIIYLSSWALEVPAFARQAKEAGLRPRELHARSLVKPMVAAMGDLAEGMTGHTMATEKYVQKDARLREIYKRMNVDAQDLSWATNHYATLEGLLKFVEMAGTLDRAKVMGLMRTPGVSVPTVLGPLQFKWNETVNGQKLNGFGTQKFIPAQVQNGKILSVWPPEVADATYRPAPR